jgi:hypothetical protein
VPVPEVVGKVDPAKPDQSDPWDDFENEPDLWDDEVNDFDDNDFDDEDLDDEDDYDDIPDGVGP